MARHRRKDKDTHVTLRVETGRHAGAELVLDPGRHSLGNSVDTDIVLTDPGIAKSHARLDLGPEGLRIVAVESPVTLVDQGVIEPGYGTGVYGQNEILLGDVRLRIAAPDRPPPRMFSGRTRAAVLTAFVLVPALLLLASQIYTIEDVWAATRTGPAPAPVIRAEPAPVDRVVPNAGARIGVEVLRARLDGAGFEDVTLRETGGSIALSGRLPQKRKGAWTRFRNELDTAFTGAVLSTSGLVFYSDRTDVPKPPVIDSVWVTDTPFVVIAGRKHIAGSSVGKTWRVTDIAPGAVTFLNGTRKVVVRLRGSTEQTQGVQDGSGQSK
ncbi:FHA domain-containing protein [uncultured Tateyamaria sp.]|uniref:FHA domain-containing protein n=1 Tax=uncultured Tateyamaria sp. TaxID=455651 RepID=UPI00261C5D65|nr:FHA domain-containing protein [uncultured Tateyamaria sp.]